MEDKNKELEKLLNEVAEISEHTRNLTAERRNGRYLTPSEQRETQSAEGKLAFSSRYLQQYGFYPLEDVDSVVVDGVQARLVLRKCLTDSYAYNNDDINQTEPSPKADAFVNGFMELFNKKDTLFVDMRSLDSQLKARTSNDKAGYGGDFATGLIACDDEKIAYIWFEEED
jgi:hypothetical protein